MTPGKPLRLLAEDADDLAVISAAIQDAVLRVGDIKYEPRARRLTLGLNRYRWESGSQERVRCGVQIAGILRLQTRRIRRGSPSAVLDLLALTFEAGEAPGGAIVLSFAGGADLRATVECVDVAMADLSGAWPARRRPSHEA